MEDDETQETVEDGVSSEQESAMTELQAEVETLVAAVAERDKTISELRAANYDLMMQLPKSENTEESEPDGDDSPDIDDLFE